MPVGSVRRYLGVDLPYPVGGSARLRVLVMEQREEALGRGEQLTGARPRVTGLRRADVGQIRLRRPCVRR